MNLGTGLRRLETRSDLELIELGTERGYLTSSAIGNLSDELRAAAKLGKDIVVLYTDGADLCLGRKPELGGASSRLEQLGEIVRFNRVLNTFPGVTVVVARGLARGFGFGLCLGADICVVDDDATFQFDEIEHGLAPLVVVEYLAEAFDWRQIVSMTVLGGVLDADQCARLGFHRARKGHLAEDVVAMIDKFDAPRIAAAKLIKNYFGGLPAGARSSNFGYDAIARLELWLERRTSRAGDGRTV